MARKGLNVLVTGVGSTTALSVIKGLREQSTFDISVIGTDINERNDIAGSHFCDKFWKVPPAAQEGDYIDALVDIITSESIHLLIPIVDAELEVIARNRDIIERLTYLLLSSYNTVRVCNDKLETYKFFDKLGIPTLKTFLVDDLGNIKNLLTYWNMHFPLIAKPRKGISSRDVYEIRDEDELFLIRRIEEPIVQEKGKGQEYTIDVFCDGQELISMVPRQRIETRAGISYKGRTEKDRGLLGYVGKVAKELKIKGPANIQCFKDGGEVKFFEINPRFSGSLPLTTAAGINTPLLALKMARGEKLKPIQDFRSIKMCRYWEEVFYYED